MRDLTQQREFVGRVRALERVELRARIEGVLRERRFVEGAMVAAGDLLFSIEPDQFEASLDLARSEVAKAEATLADATSQLQRARELSRNQNIAQSTVDQRVADAGDQMGLAHAWRTEHQQIGSLLEPGVGLDHRHHQCLRYAWHDGEIEVGM